MSRRSKERLSSLAPRAIFFAIYCNWQDWVHLEGQWFTRRNSMRWLEPGGPSPLRDPPPGFPGPPPSGLQPLGIDANAPWANFMDNRNLRKASRVSFAGEDPGQPSSSGPAASSSSGQPAASSSSGPPPAQPLLGFKSLDLRIQFFFFAIDLVPAMNLGVISFAA